MQIQSLFCSYSKLANLILFIKDANDHTGLTGVLLSLSGDEYRKNDVTMRMVFFHIHLYDPDRIFKAYVERVQFTPDSQSFDLESSDSQVFEFKAKRVAYSVFGTLSTIVGEGSADTTVVAVDNESSES